MTLYDGMTAAHFFVSGMCFASAAYNLEKGEAEGAAILASLGLLNFLLGVF